MVYKIQLLFVFLFEMALFSKTSFATTFFSIVNALFSAEHSPFLWFQAALGDMEPKAELGLEQAQALGPMLVMTYSRTHFS
jgi:hypothetical protein